MKVDMQNYLTRRVSKKLNRNWWLVKHDSPKYSKQGRIYFSNKATYIYFPKELIGKKVRFKLELVEEDEE